jgi:hypothetical protein
MSGTDVQATERQRCPYCKTPVIEVSTKGKYVNGIRPVEGERGCEFCNPTAPPTYQSRSLGRRVTIPEE